MEAPALESLSDPMQRLFRAFAESTQSDLRALAASGRGFGIVAGTGTGKTLAYLVPAILNRQRILVSTGKAEGVTEGPFGLQSEGTELHFKNIKIKN